MGREGARVGSRVRVGIRVSVGSGGGAGWVEGAGGVWRRLEAARCELEQVVEQQLARALRGRVVGGKGTGLGREA